MHLMTSNEPDKPTPDDPSTSDERPASEGARDSGKPSRRASKDQETFQRRQFFSEGLRNLLRPVADIIEERVERVKHSMEAANARAMAKTGPGAGRYENHEATRLIRPPGALSEELFLDRCSGCAQCVSACPVQAIQLIQSDDPRKNDTPYVNPRSKACVVCDDLACMSACPTGALQRVPRHLIHMGVAELRRDFCLRSDGEDCQICVEKCPIGPTAIEIPYSGADVEVKTDGCVGCGVCEEYCPTEPRAIVIKED
jgi:MauM/NapG family ferredoxin protein